MGFVYLMMQINYEGLETFKIGVTKNNPSNRRKQLSTGNPDEIRVLKQYESPNYIKIENWLHRKYSAKKTLAENEWFNLSNDDVMSFLDECKKADEIVSFLKQNNHFYK